MKIGFTINLGDFENIKIESSEQICLTDCLIELKNSLSYMKYEFKVKKFLDKIENILIT